MIREYKLYTLIIKSPKIYLYCLICCKLKSNLERKLRRMDTIEKRIQLPSNGYFGGPKEVTIRAMTTREEKIILSARDFSVFTQLVRSCITDPEDIDVGLLHQNDIMYLVYALRELTFGNTCHRGLRCFILLQKFQKYSLNIFRF